VREIKKKKIIKAIIGISSVILIFSVCFYKSLKDKQNISIESINDNRAMAFYIEQDGEYENTTVIPTSGYKLSNDSYCKVNGEKDDSITLTYKNGKVGVSNLSKPTKCYLYFAKSKAIDTIIGDTTNIEEKIEFTGIATESDTGVYSAPDDYGTSYYFRGVEDKLNNWVEFAGFYWRIIRVNGNGTIRRIYAGAANGAISSSNKTGTTTQIDGTTYMYNHTNNDNAYVGYMMCIPLNGDYPIQNETTIHSGSYVDAHSNVYDSDAKKIIDNWYKTNIVDKGYSDKIDINTGFCNNGQTASGISSGYSTARYNQFTTSYISWGSVYANGWKSIQTPTLQCTNKERDLFTLNNANIGNKKLIYPVGMITSDEAIFAGAFSDDRNKNYYLYTNQNYWTMSPWYYNNAATIGYINGGDVRAAAVAFSLCDLRPVINLRADTIFSGDGSEANPYKITE